MKGDRVEVVIDIGGSVQQFDIVATKAGRRVEVSTGRGTIEVTEVTRSGQPVRWGRFMASRVVAIIEHPADTSPGPEPSGQSARHRSGGQARPKADDSTPRLL